MGHTFVWEPGVLMNRSLSIHLPNFTKISLKFGKFGLYGAIVIYLEKLGLYRNRVRADIQSGSDSEWISILTPLLVV